jgi:adenylate cyclase
MTYHSMGRESESLAIARKAVEFAARELTLHPDNPRPAYLGAGCLTALGDSDLVALHSLPRYGKILELIQ